MKCNQCRAEVPTGSLFCVRCGARLLPDNSAAPVWSSAADGASSASVSLRSASSPAPAGTGTAPGAGAAAKGRSAARGKTLRVLLVAAAAALVIVGGCIAGFLLTNRTGSDKASSAAGSSSTQSFSGSASAPGQTRAAGRAEAWTHAERFDAERFAESLLSYFETRPHILEDTSDYAARNPMLSDAGDIWANWDLCKSIMPTVGPTEFFIESYSKTNYDNNKSDQCYVVCEKDGSVKAGLKANLATEEDVIAVRDALARRLQASGWTTSLDGADLSAVKDGENPTAAKYQLVSTYNAMFQIRLDWTFLLCRESWAEDQDYVYTSADEIAEKIISVLTVFPMEGESEQAYLARVPFRISKRYDRFLFSTFLANPVQVPRIDSVLLPEKHWCGGGGSGWSDRRFLSTTIYATVKDRESAEALYQTLRGQFTTWFGNGLNEEKNNTHWKLWLARDSTQPDSYAEPISYIELDSRRTAQSDEIIYYCITVRMNGEDASRCSGN